LSTPLIKRNWIGLALAVCALAAGALLLGWRFLSPPGVSASVTLAQFTQYEVSVRIEARKYASGTLALVGVFTPEREHFHLYSKDLPENGLNGLGRPTLIKIAASDGIKWTGPLTADQAEHDLYFKVLDINFPVYPEGPVTLSLPYEWTSKENSAAVDLAISYMACSDQQCLPPVEKKHLLIHIPSQFQAGG